MNDLAIAIIGGVVVFTFSQYFQKFIFEAILEYKKTLSEISHILLLNQAKILGGGPNEEELKDNIHTLSAKLRSFTKVIPFYSFFQKTHIFGLPKKDQILLASHSLNIIGYGVIDTGIPQNKKTSQNLTALEEIRSLLNVETTYTEPIDKP